ncbi:MAG: T9SS type A sorting domain-containing protein [Candidatus Neomarinimicrobiota bacterium]|nr:T9SS type A sorting domain-containing protein [Candidatus Neomarinimicrobiota bacterium]
MFKNVVKLSVAISFVFAQWTSDSTQNTLIESALQSQLSPFVQVASDGSTYIAWGDRRNTPNFDYRIKRLDFSGNVFESYTLSNQHSSSAAGNLEALESDTEHGVFVLWEQITNNRDELRLQHVNSTLDANGTVFDNSGLVVSGFECDRKNGSLAVIDRDNAIVSFTTSSCAGSNATDYGNAYVQKINSGTKDWGGNGILAAPRNTNGNNVLDTKAIPGPQGGAFILFSQNTTSDNSLRINFVDAQGNFTEGLSYPSGIGLGNLYNKNNWEMDAAFDGMVGVYVVWRNSSNKMVLQHINLINNRLVLTHVSPVEVFPSTASYVYPKIAVPNSLTKDRGLFIAFYDYDTSANKYGLFAKYLDKADGTLSNLFTVSTNASSLNPAARQLHDLDVTLFDKEAFVTWIGKEGDLLTRKIFVNTSGQIDSTTPETIVHDKSGVAGRSTPGAYNASHDRIGGLTVTWQQDRGNNLSSDIFAQQLSNEAVLGVNGNLLADIDDAQIIEDQDFSVVFDFNLSPALRPFISLLPVLSDSAVTASILADTLSIDFPNDWNGDLMVDLIGDWIDLSLPNDTTRFTISVAPIQDPPRAFEWVSVSLDSINITQLNAQDNFLLEWTESADVDQDTIEYIVYAKVGQYPLEEIYDTTSLSYPIPYQDIAVEAFRNVPGNNATIRFSVWAYDGTDSLKINGEDRVLYVNRYEYLQVDNNGIPNAFALHGNYPNPFNPTTQIRFDLPYRGNVNIHIYNMLGQKVKVFSMPNTPPGRHAITWNGTNQKGQALSAGVYLYQMISEDFVKTRKMILLK